MCLPVIWHYQYSAPGKSFHDAMSNEVRVEIYWLKGTLELQLWPQSRMCTIMKKICLSARPSWVPVPLPLTLVSVSILRLTVSSYSTFYQTCFLQRIVESIWRDALLHPKNCVMYDVSHNKSHKHLVSKLYSHSFTDKQTDT